MKKTLLSFFAILAFATFVNAQVPARTGWWKFDDAADMVKAQIGSPLVLTGTQTSVPGPVAGNLATQIGIGSYLTMNHGIAPNGGGDSVNVYSVQIDFSVPEIGKWHSFIQTNPSNSGGGSKGDADLFTNTSNKIGTSTTGYSTNAISVETWYRMVITVKNGEFFRVYLNGELWLEKTLLPVDGRWALVNELLLFADDDGDDAAINCSEIGIWDVALSAAQVTELGNASTVQFPDRKGWWKFDDAADMLKAEIGSSLTLTGTQTSVAGPVAGNLATQIGLGSYLTMNHGIAPNGGGDSVNEYTVQIDFSVPEIGKWHSFIQTNPGNSGGGSKGDADLFTNTSNKIGTSTTGYSANAITVDTWYRMVISVKNGEFFRVYLNGELWLEKTLLPIDGRWALVNELLLFADDDGDDAAINCSEIGIWDVALSAVQVSELGNASTVPIPVRKGWWKFDNASDMLQAEVGLPLTLTGTQTSVPGPATGNLASQIGLASYLTMAHGIAPNGGGDSVNVYSVQIDFSVPEIGKWHSFIQTNPSNSGGGSKGDADLFTNTSNKIGTSTTGYSTNAISANTWYRMVITVKNGEFFRVYLNGELWLEKTLLPVDGRWALVNELLLFADDDGDDATINCAETAIWDVALSPSEVLQLGGFAGNVLVSGITVTAAGNATTIETAGGTLQMSAAILPVNATDQTVTWSVTKGTGDASITTDGLLTAIKNGTVTVNATSNDGGNVIGSLVITISNQALIAVTGITVTSAGGVNIIDINGGTLQMSAAVLPVDATDQSVTWSVTNVTGSASITAEGLLTALTDGTVLVKATSNDPGHVVGSLEITISNQGKVRERKGWWKFDDAADMLKAEIGLPLALTGTHTSISGPVTGNLATRVPLGSYLTMTHGIDPNGGGALVNEWTLQIDFSVPEIPLWYAFFQTADGDADLFIAKTENSDISRVPNSIGTGSVSYTANTVAANTWYRMVVSVKNGEFFRIYINGELWLDSPSVQAVDGRYGLAPTLLLFQDDDGDDGIIYCSETAIWDVALTAAEALELGSIPMNVSIQDTKTNSVKFYPNPAANDLYISGKSALSKVEVYTILGAHVKEYSNVLQSINVSDLKTGVYIIRLTDTSGKTVTSKFMKK